MAKPEKELGIRAVYTGERPNLMPVASAFANALKKALNEDGCFKDPALEAEYQESIREKRKGA